MCHFCALLVNDVTRLNGMAPRGAPVIVTYTFAGPAVVAAAGGHGADDTLRAAVRSAVDVAEGTAALRFVEVEPGADAMVRFAYNDDRDGWSWANYPRSSAAAPDILSDIEMNRHYGDYGPGSSGFQVLLHELGHAMGLKHPHDGSQRLEAAYDNTNHTLMSYRWRGAPKDVYQSLDQGALETLYGEAGSLEGVRTRWDGERDVMTVIGTRSGDTLIAVNDATRIEGRQGADALFGRGAADTLRGGAGPDTLTGLDGADRLVGGRQGDQISGGWGADRLIGADGPDRLFGEQGGDRLGGGADRDRLFGGADADTLRGGGGDDTLRGGEGDDRLVGGRGADMMEGGLGADVFVLGRKSGGDIILDFDPAEGDRLDLGAFAATREEASAWLARHGSTLLPDCVPAGDPGEILV